MEWLKKKEEKKKNHEKEKEEYTCDGLIYTVRAAVAQHASTETKGPKVNWGYL